MGLAAGAAAVVPLALAIWWHVVFAPGAQKPKLKDIGKAS
jgi:hypothetical protein